MAGWFSRDTSMTINVAAICPREPDPALITRLTGVHMSMLLGDGHAVAGFVDDDDPDLWHIHWGSAGWVEVFIARPGEHEFGSGWYASVTPGARGLPLPLLMAIVCAASISIATDGIVFDEHPLIGGGNIRGDIVLARAAQGSTEPSSILDRLGYRGEKI